MFACVLLDARGWYTISYSTTLQDAHSRLGLSLDPELADLSSSKRQLALGTPLSTSWALRLQVGYHAHVTFLCTLDIWTPVCKLTQQTPYPLVHLARFLLSVLTAQRSYLPLPLNRWWCGNSLSIYPTFVTFYNDPFHHPHDGSWHQYLITKMVPIFNQNPHPGKQKPGRAAYCNLDWPSAWLMAGKLVPRKSFLLIYERKGALLKDWLPPIKGHLMAQFFGNTIRYGCQFSLGTLEPWNDEIPSVTHIQCCSFLGKCMWLAVVAACFLPW